MKQYYVHLIVLFGAPPSGYVALHKKLKPESKVHDIWQVFVGISFVLNIDYCSSRTDNSMVSPRGGVRLRP